MTKRLSLLAVLLTAPLLMALISGDQLNMKTVNAVQGINVQAFGAVGDGIANDSTAIQNAINAAGAGGTIFIPRGLYNIASPPLLFDNDQTFRGVGTNEVFSLGSGSVLKLADGSGSARVMFQARTKGTTRTDRPAWYDMQIIVDQPSDIGIDLAHVNYAHIERLEIRGTQPETDQVGVHIASNSPTTVSGGIGNRILHSEFFNLERPIIIEKEQANVNLIEGVHINGNAGGKIGVAIRGLCTGGSCNGGNSCEVDTDCSCGGVCASTGVSNTKVSPVGNRILASVIEDNTTLVLDVARRTEILDTYFEETNSASAKNIILSGEDTLFRGNTIGGSNGSSITCLQLRGATTPSRPNGVKISDNEFRNCFLGIDASVTGTTGVMMRDNLFAGVNTTPQSFAADNAIFVDDPVNAKFTKAALPSLANGSRVLCTDCVADDTCSSGGSGAVATRQNGAWLCTGATYTLNTTATTFNNTVAEQDLATMTDTPTAARKYKITGAIRCNNTTGATNNTITSRVYIGNVASGAVSTSPALNCNAGQTVFVPVYADVQIALTGTNGILVGARQAGASTVTGNAVSVNLSSPPVTIKVTGQLSAADANIAMTNVFFRVEAIP